MRRVITALTYDLKFDVLLTPPLVSVAFTDVDEDGQETHGTTTIADEAARRLWPRDLLAAVSREIDVQAQALREPGTVTARITAANGAEARRRKEELGAVAATAAKDAAHAAVLDLDAAIASKRAELAALKQVR